MGTRTQSKAFLKDGQHEKAETILNEIENQPISPTIQHRVLLVRGDLSFARGHHEEAIQLYEAANEIRLHVRRRKNDRSLFQSGCRLREVWSI